MQVEELNDTNCKTYLLVVNGEAALVDPVRERLDTYRRLLEQRALHLSLVLETHMHADHRCSAALPRTCLARARRS